MAEFEFVRLRGAARQPHQPRSAGSQLSPLPRGPSRQTETPINLTLFKRGGGRPCSYLLHRVDCGWNVLRLPVPFREATSGRLYD